MLSRTLQHKLHERVTQPNKQSKKQNRMSYCMYHAVECFGVTKTARLIVTYCCTRFLQLGAGDPGQGALTVGDLEHFSPTNFKKYLECYM